MYNKVNVSQPNKNKIGSCVINGNHSNETQIEMVDNIINLDESFSCNEAQIIHMGQFHAQIFLAK